MSVYVNLHKSSPIVPLIPFYNRTELIRLNFHGRIGEYIQAGQRLATTWLVILSACIVSTLPCMSSVPQSVAMVAIGDESTKHREIKRKNTHLSYDFILNFSEFGLCHSIFEIAAMEIGEYFHALLIFSSVYQPACERNE